MCGLNTLSLESVRKVHQLRRSFLSMRTAMARRLSSIKSVTVSRGSNWSGRTGYNAWQVEAAVAKAPVLRLEIVKRNDDPKGFVVLPRRWVVERTFSWFGRNRRIAKELRK
jgi:transposase